MDNVIIFLAKYLVFIIAAIAVFYWLRLERRLKIQLALGVILGGIIALVLVKLSGKLYYHPRPFVTQNIKPLVAHGPDNGFPSEHVTMAMTLTTLAYFYRRRVAAGLLILTVLVGLGRIWAHVHSPLDILGGLIFGAVAGTAGYYLARHLSPPRAKTHKS